MQGTIQAIAMAVIAGIAGIAVFLFGKKQKPDPTPDPTPDPLPENNPPIAFGPGLPGHTSDFASMGEVIRLDFRHRVAGCDSSGDPTFEYGAYDPEGDYLEYRIVVSGPMKDGSTKNYAVFNEYGHRIDGEWLKPGSKQTFPIGVKNPITGEKEPVALASFVVGYTEDAAPIHVMCTGNAEPFDDSELDATLGGDDILGECVIGYSVRDSRMKRAVGRNVRLKVLRPC